MCKWDIHSEILRTVEEAMGIVRMKMCAAIPTIKYPNRFSLSLTKSRLTRQQNYSILLFFYLRQTHNRRQNNNRASTRRLRTLNWCPPR